MSFRYQKRINLGKGVGLNVSKSGVSSSYRTKFGSVGSRGFTFKTGIPGLSYRSNWGKGGYGGLVIIVVFAVAGVFLIAYNLLRLLIFCIAWSYEWISVRFQKEQPNDDVNP